ncbi:MAG TPA: galactokinase [Chitinophagaceae bacterium]|nr:galactokinase [Chitinophagaceae bacterium]
MITINSTPIHKKFTDLFGSEPLIARSPGRVNIIGEHTDYNEGFVLPVAIDKGIAVAIDEREDNEIHLYSEEFKEYHKTTLSDIQPVKGWPDYVLGVVSQLQEHGHGLKGFNLVLDGDVPIGAGLSSSAAVECATIFALKELFGHQLSLLDMARLAQAAEHHFAGVRCGIMDQFASLFGKKDFAIKLDCKTLQHEYVPLQLHDYKIVLLNTNIKHSLALSEYNTRRSQCEQGIAWIAKQFPDIKSLRDVTIEMLDKIVAPKDKIIYRRCKYVIEENMRLLSACEALKIGNIHLVGQKMFQSHSGLSEQYEVSCRELDFLVENVKYNPAVIGARMMGGGFGGCTINLVKEKAIPMLAEKLGKEYRKVTDLELSSYVVNSEKGTDII